MRRLILALVALAAIILVWLWRGQRLPPSPPRASSATEAPARPTPPVPAVTASVDHRFSAADYPIAAPLNRPEGNIRQDLDVLRQVLEAWRSNFPHEGNPVGENNEITAALTGNNRLHLMLIPKNHPAINAQGELCDRWGTPFRFHQISGEHMEIRSAGPDRKFGTPDDVVGSPAVP